MSEERKKPKGFVKSVISQKLYGRDGIKEYGEAIKNLSEKAFVIDESAVVFVALFEGRERYRELVKAIGNILDAERIFNQRAIERNPEIAKEMAEAYEHLKRFNDVVAKRKKRIAMSRKRKNNEDEEQQNVNVQNVNNTNTNTISDIENVQTNQNAQEDVI
jgi:Sec-independent protein translocase protein TatA